MLFSLENDIPPTGGSSLVGFNNFSSSFVFRPLADDGLVRHMLHSSVPKVNEGRVQRK